MTALNAALRRQDLPLALNDACVTLTLKTGQITLATFDLPAHNMPDTNGKRFGKILLTGIHSEVSEQFWLPQNSTAFQLTVSLRETQEL
jgi:hypothetical protein